MKNNTTQGVIWFTVNNSPEFPLKGRVEGLDWCTVVQVGQRCIEMEKIQVMLVGYISIMGKKVKVLCPIEIPWLTAACIIPNQPGGGECSGHDSFQSFISWFSPSIEISLNLYYRPLRYPVLNYYKKWALCQDLKPFLQ